jgi:hypothetical protein
LSPHHGHGIGVSPHHTIKVKHRRAVLFVAPGDTSIGVDGITRGAVF